MPQKPIQVKIDQRFPLTIKRIGINGEGIGYYKRKIVFIDGALPGEVVVAQVTQVTDKYLKAKIHKIREVSPDRVTPKDNYENVGGIELEHLAYDAQLAFKADLIHQSLEKFQPQDYLNFDVKPTIGMRDPWGYRNKAQFQVQNQNGRLIAGLYAPNSHKLVDLPTFETQTPLTMAIMRAALKALEAHQISAYNDKKNQGEIKTIVIREAFATKQVQITFITTTPQLTAGLQIAQALQSEFPEIKSVMHNHNPQKTSLIWGNTTTLIAGEETIHDVLNGVDFELTARAFFQLNPKQTEVMYQLAGQALNLTKEDVLIDAYCGVGTIGLTLANQVDSVWGMDVIEDAIAAAQMNAHFNEIDNAHYRVGPAEKLLPQWLDEGLNPTALIVDPPRTGLDDKLMQTIRQIKPRKFVYISCNPSTLARDLKTLTRDYQVDYIQPLDMFPQTARVEAIVKLTLK